MLFVRSLLASIVQVGFFAVILLVTAESWYWLDAIIFLSLYLALLLVACAFLCVYYPASIEARLTFPFASDQPIEDKIATALIISTFVLALIFIPLDVFQFQIFLGPSFEIKCLGLMVNAIGFVTIILTMTQNEFAQPIVRLQEERGQVLIDSGLYGYIRHPMYFGFILFWVGMALWLGSTFMATIGAIIFLMVLIPRILVEEKTLRNGLSGYRNYIERVKYRIIPGLF